MGPRYIGMNFLTCGVRTVKVLGVTLWTDVVVEYCLVVHVKIAVSLRSMKVKVKRISINDALYLLGLLLYGTLSSKSNADG